MFSDPFPETAILEDTEFTLDNSNELHSGEDRGVAHRGGALFSFTTVEVTPF